MKKLLSFALFLTFIISASAQTVEKTWYFSTPSVMQVKDYQQISFGDDMLTAPAGEPALPYQAVSLLLPPGTVATNIEFIGENEIELKGSYNIWPYQPSRPLSETKKAKFYKNERIYTSNATYPVTQKGRLSTQFLNGHGFAFSAFTPVQYNPAEGKVSYFSKVTIRVTYRPGEKAAKALKNLKSSQDVRKRVALLAQNPETLALYPEKNSRSEEQYKLLIITDQQFENDFEDLRDIYLSRGVTSKVFTKQYISQNIDGQDIQEKIRNFIIQEYQDSDIEYVLLGGDVEYVPYRGFYCYVQSGGGYSDDDIPADLYYSALDGTWNDDGDNRWGEPDEDDLLPDVAVARFPSSNLTELSNLIHKSIYYQNSPVLGEFEKPLLAGEYLYDNPETWGRDYLQLIIGEHDDNGYTTIGIPIDYDIDTMYEHTAPWTGTDLINKVNQGKQFIHHVGHASQTYVAHLYNSDITDNNFYAANGEDHNYTIMQTHGCDCGAFDYSDCILEKMVNIENFAVAVIGNSRFGWFNEGQTEGPAAHLHREMVDAMFHEQIAQIGKAFVECKIQTAPWVEAPGQWEEGALRWNFYDINILGDPAMSVWNDEPIDIDVDYPEEVTVGTDSIEVTVTLDGDPLEGFSCAVMKEGELRAAALTDTNGIATLIFDPVVTETGEASLIVSGYDCLPDTNSILFIPAAGPYVVYAENTVNDSTGNNNQLVDYGEQIFLDLSLTNVGYSDAENVSGVLSIDNQWITLTDTIEQYGSIASGDTIMINKAFAFDVADSIPDQTPLDFTVTATDGDSSWTSQFQLTANAPLLVAGEITVDDNDGGNGDGMIDPGETVNFQIMIKNTGHSACSGASATMNTDNPYVTLTTGFADMGDLGVDDSITVSFTAVIDEFTPPGTPLELQLDMTTGSYTFTRAYYLGIGIIMEDFETGDFTAFEWMQGGNKPWIIISDNPYEGEYSARSGDINDNQTSALIISFETAGDDDISFYRKVSSELDWDFLKFYIDGDIVDKWSGEKDWEQFSYPVTDGYHVLKWSYEKDMNTSGGSDCGWLDNIVFPATTVIISVDEMSSDNKIRIYPNPSTGVFYLNSPILQRSSSVKVYDVNGRILLKQNITNASGLIKLDLKHPEKGLYFVEVKSDKEFVVKKLIIH